ncbi:hypothetical protein [Streptosporangium sandarakinum]|uniref:hypothetical protein n=1 Tax=Streptosporangium sandarakinum TaxID=1260955 RepID=UPI003722E9D6
MSEQTESATPGSGGRPGEARTSGRPGEPGKPGKARRTRPGPLWFAVLGGVIAWSLHIVFAWSVVELTCVDGGGLIGGIPVVVFAAVATGLPAVVVAAALVVDLLLWRRDPPEPPGRKSDRVRFMLQIGFWLNVFSVLMILMGGLAVVMLPQCVQT